MQKQDQDFSYRISKGLTNGMATWRFVVVFLLLCALEIIWNHFAPARYQFDPGTLILNLALSLIAAVQGSVIMIFQRYADHDRDKLFALIERQEKQILTTEKKIMSEVGKLEKKIDSNQEVGS